MASYKLETIGNGKDLHIINISNNKPANRLACKGQNFTGTDEEKSILRLDLACKQNGGTDICGTCVSTLYKTSN